MPSANDVESVAGHAAVRQVRDLQDGPSPNQLRYAVHTRIIGEAAAPPWARSSFARNRVRTMPRRPHPRCQPVGASLRGGPLHVGTDGKVRDRLATISRLSAPTPKRVPYNEPVASVPVGRSRRIRPALLGADGVSLQLRAGRMSCERVTKRARTTVSRDCQPRPSAPLAMTLVSWVAFVIAA